MGTVGKALRLLKRRGLSGFLREAAVRQCGLNDTFVYPGADPMEEWTAHPERAYSGGRIAVYTACMGGYDRVETPRVFPENIDYYLITDDLSSGKGSGWQVLSASTLVPSLYRSDPVLANRWCKMHPQELFPEYEVSVYLDANIRVDKDLTALTCALEDRPAAFFRHKNRDCVYEEIRACIIKGKDRKRVLKEQESRLRAKGIPEHRGLLEAPVIVRRHNSEACRRLMERWWACFLAGSKRDQIALADALWEEGIQPGELGTLGNDVRKCDLLTILPHVRRR